MSKTAQKEEYPKHKVINGQPAVRVDCPLANWPGFVYAPRGLSTEQYLTWWEKYQENGGDGRESIGTIDDLQRLYQERGHIILEHHIEGAVFDDKLNDMALMNFVAAVTQKLIIEARFLPNLPGWSSVGTNGDGVYEVEVAS